MAEESDIKETVAGATAEQPAEPLPGGAAPGAPGESPQAAPEQHPVKAEAETEELSRQGEAEQAEVQPLAHRRLATWPKVPT